MYEALDCVSQRRILFQYCGMRSTRDRLRPRSSMANPSIGSPSSFSLPQVLALVEDKLRSVDSLLRETLTSPESTVPHIGRFLTEGSGKRVRSILHLLCAQVCDYQGPHDVTLGAVIEIIHLASLIHDDVIDEADTRRGRPSTHRTWGTTISVLFGDYLYGKAMELALQAGKLSIIQSLASVTSRMVSGQMLEDTCAQRLDITENEYLNLIERKTAALFACSCEMAGLLAECDPPALDHLRAYGRTLGLAFQIVDDLLDFTGEPGTLGKPSAMDLREGKITLPVIDLLLGASPAERNLVRRIVHHEDANGEELDALHHVLRDKGSLDRTHARAAELASQAKGQVAGFEETHSRRALEFLPDLLLRRQG